VRLLVAAVLARDVVLRLRVLRNRPRVLLRRSPLDLLPLARLLRAGLLLGRVPEGEDLAVVRHRVLRIGLR